MSTPKILTGAEFNEQFAGLNFYKLTYASNKHYGMTYVDGENIDVKPFDANDTKTGLYFFETKRAFDHYKGMYTHIRKVTIPEDASVIVRDKSFRASKFLLGPSMLLGEDLDLIYTFLDTSVQKYLPTVGFYKNLLRFEPNRKNEYEILGQLLRFETTIVNESFVSDDKIGNVILNFPKVIKICHNVSYEMYQLALSLDGLLLQYVVEKFTKLIECTKQYQGFVNVADIQSKLDTLTKIAVKQNYSAIKYVKEPSAELCMLAYEQSQDADKHIKIQLPKEVVSYAITKYPELMKLDRYVCGIDETIALQIILHNPNDICLIPPNFQTEEMCKLALNADIKNFKHIDEKFSYLVATSF